MSDKVQTQQSAPDLRREPTTLAGLLKHPAYSSRFEELLKDKAAQFTSSILQVGRSLGDDCDPKSIIGSAMIAAALDLPINQSLGFAWIVPYKNKGRKVAQLQIGVRGYVQLALRTGQYSRLNVCPVYEGELVGSDKLTGDIRLDESMRKSDKVVGYASYMKLVSGFEHAEYWSIDTVKSHAQRYSQAYRSGYDSPWKTHFDQMGMKTVLSSHIRHWGPMSVSIQKAVEHDGAVVAEPDAQPDYVDNRQVELPSQTPQLDDSDQMDMSPPPPVENVVESEAVNTPKVPADNIREPVQVSPESPQGRLIDIFRTRDIKLELVMNYVNVNRLDKEHGFNAEMSGHISRWPDAACDSIRSDLALIDRIIQKFKKK